MEKEEIIVKIQEHCFESENWLKTIKYIIKLTDSTGESSVKRSPNDFKLLRNYLVAWWPGCPIPAIPKEYTKKKPSQELLPMCIVAHDIFLSKIMNKDYLGKSEIVEAFIRNPGKFSLNTFIYKSSNYSAIAEKFEDSFKEDLEYQTNTDTIIHLHEAREKIVKVLKTTENLGRMIRKNCATVDGLKKISQDLNKEFYIVQQWLKSGTEEKMLDFGDFNPSQNIEIWFLSQKETYDGVIEAIYSIDELIKIREHTDSNINSTSIELNKLALGKRTFASFISKSEDIMKRKHQQLDELNTKLKALDIIIPIISSKLLHVDVPDIERNHSQSFEGEIKGFLDGLAGKIGDVRKTLLKS